MHIKTYRTHLIQANESLFEILDAYIPRLQEKEILVITSKIISILEGSFILKKEAPSKLELIKKSADAYLDTESISMLTIKNHLLIPAAGIDESNADELYILHPKNPQKSAEEIWRYLLKRDQRKEIGVLITDSHTTPLRRGVIGASLGWCGFRSLYNYIGKMDCFNVPLAVTQTNVVDSLAASAVFCMGEGNEQTPFALIQDLFQVEFNQKPPSSEELDFFYVKIKKDLYEPLFKSAHWVFLR